mmetsp:Transcript_34434/g.78497  ORF Transcript_34434/g.78497 Transcript_34434/m.78497 type:complete len:440 (+) Transcript_34434:62-1381(+)
MLAGLWLALIPTVLAWSVRALDSAVTPQVPEIPQVCGASLLQASWGVLVPGSFGACHPEDFRGLCRANQSAFQAELLHAPIAGSLAARQPWLDDGEELVKQMRIVQQREEAESPFAKISTLSHLPITEWSYQAFENLRKVDARTVLAFQETWTDEDTELLKLIDSAPDEFVDGNLTTEKMRSYLPSIKVLEDLVRHGTVAVVGGGRSVAGHGAEIDGHGVVVRFNSHMGTELKEKDTGTHMDVHVLNHMVDFNATAEADILHMDLESSYPGETYCKRWRANPFNETSAKFSKATLAIRPAAFCGLPNILGFTRGFLFYWLVGRLFDKVHVYGMAERDSVLHYGRGPIVSEPYVTFEHFLYRIVVEMQAAAEPARADANPPETPKEAHRGKHQRPHPALAQVAAVEAPAWASDSEHLILHGPLQGVALSPDVQEVLDKLS